MLRSQSDKITLCTLLLFHHTEFDFKGHKQGRCEISPENESIAHNVFLFPGGKEGPNAQDINSLLINNTRDLKVHHYITNRVLGTHSDGGFLGDKGFQGYGIGEVEAYNYMHSPNDTLDKIDTGILKKLCLVLTDSLKKHDATFFE